MTTSPEQEKTYINKLMILVTIGTILAILAYLMGFGTLAVWMASLGFISLGLQAAWTKVLPFDGLTLRGFWAVIFGILFIIVGVGVLVFYLSGYSGYISNI